MCTYTFVSINTYVINRWVQMYRYIYIHIYIMYIILQVFIRDKIQTDIKYKGIKYEKQDHILTHVYADVAAN